MANRKERLDRFLELVDAHPGWSYRDYNSVLTAEFGQGLRKKDLLATKRALLDVPKRPKGVRTRATDTGGQRRRFWESTPRDATRYARWHHRLTGTSYVGTGQAERFRHYERHYGMRRLPGPPGYLEGITDDLRNGLQAQVRKWGVAIYIAASVTFVVHISATSAAGARRQATEAYKSGSTKVVTHHIGQRSPGGEGFSSYMIEDVVRRFRELLEHYAAREYATFLVSSQLRLYGPMPTRVGSR